MGVGDAAGLVDSTGVAAGSGEAAWIGEEAGIGFGLGETTGAGPVLLLAAGEFWEVGELPRSAATPGRVDVHHIRTNNNTGRRNTLSRLIIVR